MKFAKYIVPITLLVFLACGGAAKKEAAKTAPQLPDQFSSYLAYDYFVKGNLAEQSGDLESAAEQYRKALFYDNKSIEIKRVLSDIYIKQKKYSDAMLIRAEIEDKTADDYTFIGDCLRYTSDIPGAISYYNQAVKADSSQYMAHYYLARIYYLTKQYASAEAEYKSLVRYAPDRAEALIDYGDFSMELNKTDQAFDAYSEAAKINSDDYRASSGMVAVLVIRGDTLTADSILVSTAEKNWDNPKILDSILTSFIKTGNFKEAQKTAGRIAELNPSDFDALKSYYIIATRNNDSAIADSLLNEINKQGGPDAVTYYYLALIKRDNKDLPAAEDYLRKSLALTDSIPEVWTRLANTLDGEGKYSDALETMRRALSAVPYDSINIMFLTSTIHANNKHYDLARDGYLRILKTVPDGAEIRFNLASAYERLGEFDKAEEGFKWILEKYPDNALALNYLGYMYADKGIKLDTAQIMIEKALKVDPKNGAYLDSYAWVLYKLGRYDEALIQMQKAMESNPKDAVIFEHEGDIYSAMNNIEKAKESWGKALQLDPENEALKKKLDSK